jgi:hypothetical protein
VAGGTCAGGTGCCARADETKVINDATAMTPARRALRNGKTLDISISMDFTIYTTGALVAFSGRPGPDSAVRRRPVSRRPAQ